jgi:hypothetical protein
MSGKFHSNDTTPLILFAATRAREAGGGALPTDLLTNRPCLGFVYEEMR